MQLVARDGGFDLVLRGQVLIGLGRRDEGRAELQQALALLGGEGADEAELAPLRALLAGR